MVTRMFTNSLPAEQSQEKSARARLDTPRVSRATAMARPSLAGLFALVLLVSGCMVGPDFVTPEAPLEKVWTQQEDPRVSIEAAESRDWWTVFDDPVLNTLIEKASVQNLDLQVAGLRILEARAQLGVAVGFQYPQTQELSVSATINQLSEYAPNAANRDRFYYDYQVGFDAAWELDFWGRFRRGVESANATLYASFADYDDLLVSLIAEVARTYTQIRIFEQRLVFTRQNVTLQQKSLELATARYEGGATSELDVTQAAALLKETQATIPRFEAGLRQAKNALAILLGIPPVEIQPILGPPNAIPAAPVEVAVGIPAELLQRRPDIRRAEFQAAAQSASIGIAKSELFPRLSILGSLGLRSSDKGAQPSNFATFADIFAGGSFTYMVGPDLKWPILNYGRLINDVRVQDARFQQFVVDYRNTVLRALRDVEDGIVGFLRAQEETAFLSEAVNQYKRSSDLSLIRYMEGLSTYQRVIDSQRALTQQQDQLASAQGTIATNLIATYKALGGGWELRQGRDVVPAEIREEMRERTYWGDLLQPGELPDETQKPPTGQEIKIFNKPDF